MAITRKIAPASATTEAASAPNSPQAAPAVRVILVNGCSTYVTPEREVFYARDSEGKTKVYEVTAEQASRLLSYRDDWNKRFFKQTDAASTDTQPDTTAKVQQARGGPAGSVAHDPSEPNNDDDDGEIDTGAMSLKDRDGNSVGVTV